jgi:ribose 5-phosphate isomerase RpiB
MKCAVALEPVPNSENRAGYFYAHVLSLGLTAHGLGAAKDLVKLWLEEKHHHREEAHSAQEMVLATIEV